MNRVLFVDDDADVRQTLEVMVADARGEWSVGLARSGAEALEILGRAPFDVVVADMRMPGMSADELLTTVMARHPNVVRIVLSDDAEDDSMIRTAGTVHQYVAKPCDAHTLKRTIARACSLRLLLADGDLKQLVSQMKSLPSVPALYTRLLAECRAARGSLNTVGEIIGEDIGMTAQVLHLVNSAFFGLRTRVTDPVQAVQFLGLHTVKGLVLCAGVFSQFDAAKMARFPLLSVWRHSLITSSFAQIIARAERSGSHLVSDASVAGLLHDAGQLVLVANLPERYGEALALAERERSPLCDAEMKTFGATHATVGAYLLGLWGLPDSIVEAVAMHHPPVFSHESDFSAQTAVHVAVGLADELIDQPGRGDGGGIDLAYLGELGLMERLPAWRAACEAFAGETNADD